MKIVRFFYMFLCLMGLNTEMVLARCNGCRQAPARWKYGRSGYKPQYYECNSDSVHADTYYKCSIDECGY